MQNISLKDKQLNKQSQRVETKGSLIQLKSKHSTIPDKKSNGSLTKLMNENMNNDQFQLRQEEENKVQITDEIDNFGLNNNQPKNIE